MCVRRAYMWDMYPKIDAACARCLYCKYIYIYIRYAVLATLVGWHKENVYNREVMREVSLVDCARILKHGGVVEWRIRPAIANIFIYIYIYISHRRTCDQANCLNILNEVLTVHTWDISEWSVQIYYIDKSHARHG